MKIKEISHYRVHGKDHHDIGDAIEHAVNLILAGEREVKLNLDTAGNSLRSLPWSLV